MNEWNYLRGYKVQMENKGAKWVGKRKNQRKRKEEEEASDKQPLIGRIDTARALWYR